MSLSTLSNLHVQRNPYHLPTETLEAIFLYGAGDYYYYMAPHCTTPTVPSWVNVSYVSRRWRNVALNYPTLWSYLFTASPHWTEELLARSKQAPLKLHFSLRLPLEKWELHIWEQVMNHVGRIEELCLRLSRHDDNIFHSLFSSCAPRLLSLEISTETRHSHPEWPSMFNGDTLAVRRLRLSGCSIRWLPSQLSGLKALILEDCPVLQDIPRFLTTLGCRQGLTYLFLDHALTSAAGFLSSTAFHGFQKINLPHLARLFVTAPLSAVIALLSCVNIPTTTEVRLECGDEDDPSSLDDYAPLCSFVTQKVSMYGDPALCSQPIRLLNVGFELGQEEVVKITFSTSEYCTHIFNRSYFFNKRDCDIPLQIVLHWPQSMENTVWEDVISHISCPAPLSTIQDVYVSNPPSSQAFWTLSLGRLPGLRYLELYDGYMPPIASILLSPRDVMEEGGDPIIAPELQTVKLRNIAFATDPEGSSNPARRCDLQSLRDALSARKGTRVQLAMTKCIQGQGARPVLVVIGTLTTVRSTASRDAWHW